MTTTFLKPLTVAIAAASLVGCFSSSSSEGTGSLSLDVTDAPVDSLEEVRISFTGVTLNPRDGDRIQISLDEEQMEEQPIDMLTLQGGNAASLISDEEVPAGEYQWIRFNTAENESYPDMYVVEEGGGTPGLSVRAARGLQLSGGFTVPQGGTADFTVDFDLRAAITKPESETHEYFLRPSLRLIDNTEVGQIKGEVDSSLVSEACSVDDDNEPGAVYVYEGSDAELVDYHIDEEEGIDQSPLMSASVDFDGDVYSYVAAFLTEGDYTIAYTCDLDDPDEEDDLAFHGERNVTVEADETQEENFDGGDQ